MNFTKLFVAAALCGLPTIGTAATITADTVIEYFESDAGIGGTGTNPNGGGGGISNNSEVPLSHVTDGNASTFISLPTGSFLTLGFSTGFIFDGAGDDLFIDEFGNGGEDADVFVSEDFGATFTYLARAFGNQTTSLDFSALNYSGQVNAVKIVGLDDGGSAPGFDLTFVKGLEGSVVVDPQGPISAVPLPAVFWRRLG